MDQKIINNAGTFFITSTMKGFSFNLDCAYKTLTDFLAKLDKLDLDDVFTEFAYIKDDVIQLDMNEIYENHFRDDMFMKHHPFFERYARIIIRKDKPGHYTICFFFQGWKVLLFCQFKIRC